MSEKKGRPSKLNAELINSIQQWLRMGYFVEDAARMAGIHKVTLYRWLEKGREQREAGGRVFVCGLLQRYGEG